MRVSLGLIHRQPTAPLALLAVPDVHTPLMRLYRSRLAGLGVLPGCPAGDLPSLMQEWVQENEAFPSALSGEDPSQGALEYAQALCEGTGGASAFGCPPLAGCDPQTIQSVASAAGRQVLSSPSYAQVISADAAMYGGAFITAAQNPQVLANLPSGINIQPYAPAAGGPAPSGTTAIRGAQAGAPSGSGSGAGPGASSAAAGGGSTASDASSSPSTGNTSNTTATSSGFDLAGFLKQTTIGVPNWLLGVGLIAAVFIGPKLLGGRR